MSLCDILHGRNAVESCVGIILTVQRCVKQLWCRTHTLNVYAANVVSWKMSLRGEEDSGGARRLARL
jgi:hypothetical protein